MNDADPAPEFSRRIDLREVNEHAVTIEADADERAKLAERFALVEIKSLTATVTLSVEDERVDAAGRLQADIVQTCAVSGDELPTRIAEQIAFAFVPQGGAAIPDEEVELADEELDEIPYTGTTFDLGEAIAQSLALAIDPYAVGSEAEAFRERHDLGEKAPDGPLQQALRKLGETGPD